MTRLARPSSVLAFGKPLMSIVGRHRPHSTTGGADDYRLYYVHFAKANHSRGSSQHLPEHRAKVSRRTRFVSEDLRALPRRGNSRWRLPLEFEARGRSNVHRILALIRPREVRH